MAYQMILRMFTRAPASLIFAMTMAFFINSRLALIYLGAVIFLAIILAFALKRVTKYFSSVFKKYDDLNASVQENVSAIRVVKAYVREDYEIRKYIYYNNRNRLICTEGSFEYVNIDLFEKYKKYVEERNIINENNAKKIIENDRKNINDNI